jgi:cell division inhibitor SulA
MPAQDRVKEDGVKQDSGTQESTAREGSVSGNVTEIILPAGQVENMQLLLPMLTQLNRERRWLAWIDPPAELVQKWQQIHGIVTGEILVLRSTHTHDGLTLAKRALGAGTCHAVVMWTPERLGGAAFKSLQSASAQGQSHGVILRQR